MNTATRLRSHGKNLVQHVGHMCNSTIDLSGLSETDVVWVKTRLGNSRYMDGCFIRMDESQFWKYTALEVYKATPKQAAAYLKARHYVELKPGVARDLSYTINGATHFLAGWGPEAEWFDICNGLKVQAEAAAIHYYQTHPEAKYEPLKVKLDVNGEDLGTFLVTVKLNPEYTVKEL